MFSKVHHWNSAYMMQTHTNVSWYQQRSGQSLAFIGQYCPSCDARIIDIGSGASTLIDDLVHSGFNNITALDIAESALAQTKSRIGMNSERVTWVVGDIADPTLEIGDVDIWHDRAVFHFLTLQKERDAYLAQMRKSVRDKGIVIIATFSTNGPEQCSGLPVVRYDKSSLENAIGNDFYCIDHALETHVTPMGTQQAFTYCVFRKGNSRVED